MRVDMIVVCGEALVDVVPFGDATKALPGGSPANVAVALGRLGIDVALLARLSTDAYGGLIRAHLSASNVDLSYAQPTDAPTTVATVRLDASGSAQYSFQLEGGADDGWRVEDLPARLPDGAALHVSGALALGLAPMRTAFDALLAREAGRRLICFDPNPRPALSPDREATRAVIESWVSRADIARASEDDLAWAYPGQGLVEVARHWRSLGPALVIITRGAGGVYALGSAGAVTQIAPNTVVVDTVGAGDAFTAGLLAALSDASRLTPAGVGSLDVAGLVDVLSFAQRVAALTCARPGADPPRRFELA